MIRLSPTGATTRCVARLLLVWLALGVAACQSPAPPPSAADGVVVDEKSSMLAVQVRFPALGRDPSLVRAWFVRGPVHAGLSELPLLVRASFVKDSRAYLLDPEPGTWSLVAVSAAVSPPRNRAPVAGVAGTVAAGGEIGTAYVLTDDLIERTRVTIAPGRFVFMGELTVEPGERVHALTFLEESLEQQLAEAVRPGSTYRTGIAAAFSRTWTVDPVATTFLRTEVERDAFLRAASDDLGASPWAAILPAPAWDPERAPLDEAWRDPPAPPAPSVPEAPSRQVSEPVPAPPPEPALSPEAPAAEPERAETRPAPSPEPSPIARAAPAPEPAEPPETERAPAPAAPPPREIASGSGDLDDITAGMLHTRVREILGDPDERSTRSTARAWIPFYSGPGTHERTWVYRGRGKVVFTVDSHRGTLRVVRVVRAGPTD